MTRVLLHGFTGGVHSFEHLGLADARTPLLPGHGGAPAAQSWSDALDRLDGELTSHTILAGYSMGARLALALALRHPEKIERLVLASGTAGLEDPLDRAQRLESDALLAQSIEAQGVPAFIERWEQHPSLESLRPFAKQLARDRLAHTAPGLASALRFLGPGAQPSYWDALSDLDVPVVLLAGADDAKFSAIARRLHALLPRSELHILTGCGHAPHLERPDIFLEALR